MTTQKQSRLTKRSKKYMFEGESQFTIPNTKKGSTNTLSKERKLGFISSTPNAGFCDPLLNPYGCASSDIGGSSPTPSAPPPPQPTGTGTCSGQATLTEGAQGPNTSTTTVQNFTVGANVWAGWQYQMGVYGVVISIDAVSGDSANSIAQRLANAINNTALATWNQFGSNNHSFKPSAIASGANVQTTVDNQHSFFGGASGTCPATTPPPPILTVTSYQPIAVIQPVSDITLPNNSIQLDGSQSYTTPSGGQKTFIWSLVSGPSLQIDNVNSPTPILSGLVEGAYIMQLTVQSTGVNSLNNQPPSDTKQIAFHVNPALAAAPPSGPSSPTYQPMASIQPVADLTLPTDFVTLDGSNSSTNPAGGPLQYLWSLVTGNSVNIDNVNSPTPKITGLKAGNYVFKLTVTCNGVQDSQNVSFVVNAAQPVPVTVTNPIYTGLGGYGFGGGTPEDTGDQSTGLPKQAAKPQRNWLWIVVAGVVVGYFVFQDKNAGS
jgi:hypothetical protein